MREPIDLALRVGGTTRVGVSICEDMWDDFYDVKPLPELAAKGAAVLAQPQRLARSIPASATSATP